jgi:hypothetical protein
MYCAIFTQSRDCGAREAVIARQPLCKHATIPEPSLKIVRTQQWTHLETSEFGSEISRESTGGN